MAGTHMDDRAQGQNNRHVIHSHVSGNLQIEVRFYFQSLTLKKGSDRRPRDCVCVRACVCVSLAIDSSEAIEVIIITLGTVTASVMVMHYVLILLTLTFIQGHTDLNHENHKYLITSETVQAMPINFAVKIVCLKIYVIVFSPMPLLFTQGHNCV